MLGLLDFIPTSTFGFEGRLHRHSMQLRSFMTEELLYSTASVKLLPFSRPSFLINFDFVPICKPPQTSSSRYIPTLSSRRAIQWLFNCYSPML